MVLISDCLLDFLRVQAGQTGETESDEVLDESLQRRQNVGRPDQDVQHTPQETGEEAGDQAAAQAVKHHHRRSHRHGKTRADIERNQGQHGRQGGPAVLLSARPKAYVQAAGLAAPRRARHASGDRVVDRPLARPAAAGADQRVGVGGLRGRPLRERLAGGASGARLGAVWSRPTRTSMGPVPTP